MIKNQNNVEFEQDYDFDCDWATIAHTRESLVNKVPKEANRRTLGVALEEAVDPCSREAMEDLDVRSEKEELSALVLEFRESEGQIALETLEKLKNGLESVSLSEDPEARKGQLEVINPLLEGVNESILRLEIPERMSASLAVMGNIQKKTGLALEAKRYGELDTLNQEALREANAIKKLLDALRKNDPDRLYTLGRELFRLNPEAGRQYKTLLVHYVGTHNTFEFSPKVLEELRNKSNDAERGRFAKALHSAYVNRPKNDKVVDFLQKASRVPGNRIMETLRRAA